MALVGALFLGIIAVLPVIAGPHIFQHIIEWILVGAYDNPDALTYQWTGSNIVTVTYRQLAEASASNITSHLTFGGTSILIIVGVVIETFRGLESELTMRNYKGFL